MLRTTIERARARRQSSLVSSSNPVTQIVISYRGTILEVAHLDASAPAFTIGEAPHASFKLDGAALSDRAATVLVERRGGRATLTIPPSFEATLVHDGVELERRASVELQSGTKVTLRAGELRFDVALVERERVEAGPNPLDRPFWASFAGTAAVAVTALMLMRAMPDDGLSLALEDAQAQARFASYFEQADMPVEPEPEQATVREDASTETHSTSTQRPRVKGPAGETGGPGSPGASGKAGSTGPRRSDTSWGRAGDPIAAAQTAGILGMLAAQDQSFLASAEGAFGDSEADALLWGNAAGLLDDGIGGVGVVGGDRAGGTASELASLGATGLLGTGTGDDGGLTWGRGPGYDERAPKRVRVVPREAKTTNIDKDVIRRIVRGHINEIRGCYNAGLARDPNLGGRVTVQFSIVANGKVASAIIEQNTTRSDELGRCISQAVKRWKFPAVHGGGNALVSYPFVLRAG